MVCVPVGYQHISLQGCGGWATSLAGFDFRAKPLLIFITGVSQARRSTSTTTTLQLSGYNSFGSLTGAVSFCYFYYSYSLIIGLELEEGKEGGLLESVVSLCGWMVS